MSLEEDSDLELNIITLQKEVVALKMNLKEAYENSQLTLYDYGGVNRYNLTDAKRHDKHKNACEILFGFQTFDIKVHAGMLFPR